MVFTKFFVAIALVAVLVPSTSATDFMVGDDKGWTTNFDYQKWAEGKEFHVGDRLVFKYPQGAHDVLRVNGTVFQQCLKPADVPPLNSGNDVIPLATPGKKWYICGVAKHCEEGNQKLTITVWPEAGSPQGLPAPNPTPTSSARASISSAFYALTVALATVSGVIMV
ncbi:hypothetical protein K2173_012891 [Erythroxylum novogranatense]|uniref:Phytocyanin domain-containing protein n=2 Tax=Erythroxylum novogranatense TaxID=1862640 RepID=A0AAV8S660_9ROSI|nr:hypothetical protein K2173_012891 [Erythroxylum novogranatense]